MCASLQPALQTRIFAIDAVGHDQPKGNPSLPRLFDEGPGQVRFGVEGGVSLSLWQTACWSIGLDAYRDVPRAIGPTFSSRQRRALATCPNLPKYCWAARTIRCPRLPIAGLVQDEHPGWVRPQIRVRLPQFQTLAIDRLNIPRLHHAHA
jgi:hypothetical protein